MLATVIIVSYNSSRYLPGCLESVFEHLPDECEVIVVDNASSDGSADLVKARFPNAIVIENRINAGFAAANNLAASKARGQFLVALNPDTVVTPGWVEALIEPFGRPNTVVDVPIGATTAKILMMSRPQEINACGNSVHISGITVCRGFGCNASDKAYAKECAVAAFSGACFAMPTELWNRLGGFDEAFFMYMEDTDLSLRVCLAGFAILYQPNAVIYHDYVNRFNRKKLFYLERNRLQLLAKTYSATSLFALLPAFLLVECLTLSFCCLRGSLLTKFATYWWLIKHYRLIESERRRVQLQRARNDFALLCTFQSGLQLSQVTQAAPARAAMQLFRPLFTACRFIASRAARRSAVG